jgi:flagellar motor switch protein FliG
MSIYPRYKKEGPKGFRKLVELMESAPKTQREKMIEAGMKEDPVYTAELMKFMITFEDILKLKDMELTELIAETPPEVTAAAISKMDKEKRSKFEKCAQPRIMAQIRDVLEMKEFSLRDIGGAQLRMIQITRELEGKGVFNIKSLPKV